MKTISVSVEIETHRQARIRAAETGTTVSAMMRNLLVEFLQCPVAESTETEHQRRGRLLDEVLEDFRNNGIGLDTGRILSREEIYDRNAPR